MERTPLLGSVFRWWADHTSRGRISYFPPQRDVALQPRWGPLTWSTASCCFAQQSLTVTWLLAAVFVLRLPRLSGACRFKCLHSLCSQLPLWKILFSRPVVLLLPQCLHIPLVYAHVTHPRLPLMGRLVPQSSDISGRSATGSWSESRNHLAVQVIWDFPVCSHGQLVSSYSWICWEWAWMD